MKKRIRSFVLVCAVSLALLTSCGEKREAVKPEALSEDFDKTAVITLDGSSYTAEFRRGGADIWECEFVEPETIAGLKLTASGEVCKIEFKGLDYTVQRDDLPEYGVMPLITECLDSLIAGRDISCVKDGKTVTEKGMVNGEDFSAQIKDGELVSLQIARKLTADFS